MRTSQEKSDKAIEKLMLKEGGGKITMPQSVKSSTTSPTTAHQMVKQEKYASPTKRKLSPLKSDDSPVKRAKIHDNGVEGSSLSDVFQGRKIFISSKIPEHLILKRYCVAFGGEIISDKKLADLLVLQNKSEHEKCVTKEWIIRKICNQ